MKKSSLLLRRAGRPAYWAACVSFMAASGGGARAQPPRGGAVLQQQTEQIKRAEALKQPPKPPAEEGEAAPETYPGESEDLGPQMLLKKKKRLKLFEASLDSSITWTSNASFSSWNPAGSARDTAVWNEVASLALAPSAIEVGSGKLSLRTGYRHVFSVADLSPLVGRAARNDLSLNQILNVQVSTVFLSANYNFRENWNASLGLDYTRVMNGNFQGQKWRFQRLVGPMKFWNESYVEFNPTWSLARSISLGEKLGLTVSYFGGYHFSQTDGGNSLDKLDSGANVSLMYMPTQTFLISPGLRFMYGHFTRTQSVTDPGERRRTTSVAPNLSFMWMPKPWISARAGLSADFFRSNDSDQPSYNKYDVSSGFTLTFKF